MVRFLILTTLFFAPYSLWAQSYDVEIFANVPGCGDNIIQVGEQCDGTNLGGSSCALSGFDAGTLSCSSVCTLVTAACVINPPSGGGTQIGFDDNTDAPISVITNLVVTGYFMPLGRLSLLKDGVVAGTVFADSRGYFQATLSGLAPGEYLLMVSGSGDGAGVVLTDSFIARVYKDSTTKISGIVLPPLGLATVRDGGVYLSGGTVPGATVFLNWGDDIYETKADEAGNFSFQNIPKGEGAVSYRFGVSYFGDTTYGSYQTLKNQDVTVCSNQIDITSDCRVNFVDFAITLWWYLYNKAESKIDFDGNGRLDLIDFSIMAYYWTG